MAINPQLLLCFTSLAGIVPAIVIMYYLLKNYEMLLQDTPIYGFFAGGLIMGMVTFALHALIDPQVVFGPIAIAIFVFILAFPAFEELAKYIILYYKKYLGKFDTQYIGISLGLGFGATSIIGVAYQSFFNEPEILTTEPLVIPNTILLSIGFVGLHATTGGLIGYGSAKKIKWKLLGRAILFHMVFNIFLLLFWQSRVYMIDFVLACAMATMSVLGLLYLRDEIMLGSLPSKLARKRRRDIRKRRQKGMARMIKGKGKVTWKSKTSDRSSDEEE